MLNSAHPFIHHPPVEDAFCVCAQFHSIIQREIWMMFHSIFDPNMTSIPFPPSIYPSCASVCSIWGRPSYEWCCNLDERGCNAMHVRHSPRQKISISVTRSRHKSGLIYIVEAEGRGGESFNSVTWRNPVVSEVNLPETQFKASFSTHFNSRNRWIHFCFSSQAIINTV